MPLLRRTLVSLLVVALIDPALAPGQGGAPKGPRTDAHSDPLPPHARARLGSLRFRHMTVHGWGVRPLAFALSPDGRLLASGGEAYSLCLWDATTGRRLLCRETVGGGLPWAMSFSADGKTLAARVGQGAFLYDVATGKDIPLRWPGQQWGGQGDDQFALSPDGQTRALLRRKIYLRDARTDRDLHTFVEKGDRGFFVSVLYSPDGKTLIAGSWSFEGFRVYFWDVATGRELRVLESPDGSKFDPNQLALSPDGKVLATGGKTIRLWDTANGHPLLALQGGGKQFSFSPNGKTLAVWEGKTVRFYEVGTGRERGRLQGFVSDRIAFAFAPDSRTGYLNDDHGLIRRVDLMTGKEIPPPDGHTARVLQAALSADGKWVASLGAEGTVRVWNTAAGKQVRCFRVAAPGRNPHRVPDSGAVALSPDGSLAAAEDGQAVRLWDVAKGTELRHFDVEDFVRALAFSPDGSLLAATGAKTWLWQVGTGKLRVHYQGLPGPGFAFSPDGEALIAASGRTFKATTGGLLRPPDNPMINEPFAISADGKTLVVGNTGKEIQVFDNTTGKRRGRFEVPQPSVLALTADGRVLATNDRSVILLWDTASGTQLLRLPGHEGPVSSLAFTPDGKTLVSSSSDTTLLIWDVPPLLQAVGPKGKP